MWSNAYTKPLVGVLGVLTGIGLFFAAEVSAEYFIPSYRASALIEHCHAEADGSQQVECIFRVISKELRKNGIGPAFEIFNAAYRDFPSFIAVSCHVHAHRLGDLAYYQVYSGTKDLDALDFTQDTTACGYGFFHGFLEHKVQDNPDPSVVTATCDYLVKRLGSEMGDIERICYHGSGHGFLLVEAAISQKSWWGDLNRFTEHPLSLCGKLQKANDTDKEECKEGIFNVIAEWMETKQYGFVLTKESLFKNCLVVPADVKQACYYEMAQKSSGFANRDPKELEAFVAQIPNKRYREMSFQVGIASIVGDVLSNGSEYKNIIGACDSLSDSYFAKCMSSIVAGLYEHGEPQEEYKKPLEFCAEAVLDARGQTKPCYEALASRLERFYAPEKVQEICGEFPKAYRDICENPPYKV